MELTHIKHWLSELRARHVKRVTRAVAAYGLVAIAIIEVTEPVMHALHLPEWTLSLVVALLGLGFPVVAVVAWIGAEATAAQPEATARAHAESEPRPPPADGSPAPRSRIPLRVALPLALAGLAVAAPGLAYFLILRDRSAADAGAAASRSIAVLPFADLSAARDQEYFADGVAEEILNALVHVEGLRVSGRTSSFSFKGKPATTAEIGRELNVSKLLQGSVRKDGNRVRVTAQLVDVARGDHLWAESYDRELNGIFAVQDEIAHAVVEALKVKILPGRASGPKGNRPTKVEAYNAYLLGRHLFDLGTRDGMRGAVTELERALAVDPEYAPAWAWLSVSILNSGIYFSPGAPAEVDGAARRAVAAAERAVALDPGLAESWSARGWMRTSLTWDWAGARADFDRALALSPRDTNILIRKSHLMSVLGQYSDAIAGAHEVIGIDPLYAWAWVFLAGYYLDTGRPDLARDAASRAVEIAPDHFIAIQELGIALLLLGKPGDALEAFQRQRSEVLRLTGTALAQHDLGHPEQEGQALAALRARFGDGEPYEIALVHAWRGDRDEAFTWLDRAVSERGGRGFSRLAIRNIKGNPLLRKVREDGRWAALLARMGLPAD